MGDIYITVKNKNICIKIKRNTEECFRNTYNNPDCNEVENRINANLLQFSKKKHLTEKK